MERYVSGVRQAGYSVSWGERKVGGFPFRIDVRWTGVALSEPSGWGLTVPELKAEAYVYAPDHWVAVASEGARFTRRDGGSVNVAARVLRASLVGSGAPFPRLTIEGEGLAFQTKPGAAPYWLEGADHLQFHLRPGPADQGALLLRIVGARARLSGLVAQIAQGGPVSVVWDSVFSHASAVRGQDWPSAIKAWSAANGALTVRQATLTAGESILILKGGDLTTGTDGRIKGALDAQLRSAPKAFAAMGEQGAMPPQTVMAAQQATQATPGDDTPVSVTLTFQDGKTLLGPLEISPAPRIF